MRVLKITDLFTNQSIVPAQGQSSFEVLEYGERYVDLRLPVNYPKNVASIMLTGIFETNNKEFSFICKTESIVFNDQAARIRLMLIQYDKVSWFGFLKKKVDTQSRLDDLLAKLKGEHD